MKHINIKIASLPFIRTRNRGKTFSIDIDTIRYEILPPGGRYEDPKLKKVILANLYKSTIPVRIGAIYNGQILSAVEGYTFSVETTKDTAISEMKSGLASLDKKTYVPPVSPEVIERYRDKEFVTYIKSKNEWEWLDNLTIIVLLIFGSYLLGSSTTKVIEVKK